MKRNFRIVLQYDGTAYRGWQVQPEGPTIQGELERCLATICGSAVRVTGAGRTDAGAHALGQVAGFQMDTGMEAERIAAALNGLLPRDIRVLEAAEAEAGFHARYGARSKVYFYQVCTLPVQSPFLLRYSHHHRWPLDLERMRRAAAAFCGRHDFSAFCAADDDARDKVRTIHLAEVFAGRGRLVFVTEGEGFLRHQVRVMAGTLLEVGRGRFAPEEVARLLGPGERGDAGPTLPAKGLFLLRVRY